MILGLYKYIPDSLNHTFVESQCITCNFMTLMLLLSDMQDDIMRA